jgi:hypothetical protein
MARRERKRKDPVFLREAIKNANREIKVLEKRIYTGCGYPGDENRLCCLMNQTLPKLQNKLDSRIKGEDYNQGWIH